MNTVIVRYRDLIVRNVRRQLGLRNTNKTRKEEEHTRARSSNLGRRLLVLKCKIFNELDLKEREVDLIELATEKLDCSLSPGNVEDDRQFG